MIGTTLKEKLAALEAAKQSNKKITQYSETDRNTIRGNSKKSAMIGTLSAMYGAPVAKEDLPPPSLPPRDDENLMNNMTPPPLPPRDDETPPPLPYRAPEVIEAVVAPVAPVRTSMFAKARANTGRQLPPPPLPRDPVKTPEIQLPPPPPPVSSLPDAVVLFSNAATLPAVLPPPPVMPDAIVISNSNQAKAITPALKKATDEAKQDNKPMDLMAELNGRLTLRKANSVKAN